MAEHLCIINCSSCSGWASALRNSGLDQSLGVDVAKMASVMNSEYHSFEQDEAIFAGLMAVAFDIGKTRTQNVETFTQLSRILFQTSYCRSLQLMIEAELRQAVPRVMSAAWGG